VKVLATTQCCCCRCCYRVDDDDDDASWQWASQKRLVRFAGITVIRDIINALLGTRSRKSIRIIRLWDACTWLHGAIYDRQAKPSSITLCIVRSSRFVIAIVIVVVVVVVVIIFTEK